MAEYYLISQLPSLDGIGENATLPITEERFLELCGGFLNQKSLNTLKELTLLPPMEHQKCSSALIQAWNDGERRLRLALGKARADKMSKPFPSPVPHADYHTERAVLAAMECEDPLRAEQVLNQYRLEFLETLRPIDTFAEDFLYYYGLRLKLLQRIARFDTDKGRTAYKNIYQSIVDGDRLEVTE